MSIFHSLCVASCVTAYLAVGFAGKNMCTDIRSLKNVHVDNRLGESFLTQKHDDTAGFMSCAKECLLRKRCKSFNFKTGTGECELNQLTSAEGGNLDSDDNWVYSDIAHVNTALAGVCASHLCTEDQVCQPGVTSPVCYQCSNASECGVCSSVRETANKQYHSHGCFFTENSTEDVQGPFEHLIDEFDQYNMNEIELAIGDCAAAARSAGFELFGLEDRTNCYGGSYAEAALKHPVPLSSCSSKCPAGVGEDGAMLIYQWL